MIEEDETSNRFLPRIRAELDKLHLTEEQKNKVAPKLLKYADFLDTSGGKRESGYLRPDSMFFEFANKLRTTVDALQKYGLTFDDYLDAAIKVPQLFYAEPETITRNVEAMVTRFEAERLTAREYFKAATDCPQIFYQSPETVTGHITSVAKHFEADGLTTSDYFKAAVKDPRLFSMLPATIADNVTEMCLRFEADGLTTRQYLKAATEQPLLFYQSPDTLERNIRGVVDLFTADGLTTREYLKAALKQPSNFGQSPETLANNIIGLVNRFEADGLSALDYLRAAIKQPSLFATSPETVAGHITRVVERFAADGLTTRDYLRAALRQPSLFTMSSETIARHIDTVLGFSDSGIFKPPLTLRPRNQRILQAENPSHAAVIDFLLKRPALMCLADDNYGLREVHQRLTNGPTDARMLTDPRYAVENSMMGTLGHSTPLVPVPDDGFVAGAASPTEDQAKRFVLRALMHAGFIKGGSMER